MRFRPPEAVRQARRWPQDGRGQGRTAKFEDVPCGRTGFFRDMRNEAILGGGHCFQRFPIPAFALDLVGSGQGAVIGFLDLGVVAEGIAGLPVGGLDESLGNAFVGAVIRAAQVVQ